MDNPGFDKDTENETAADNDQTSAPLGEVDNKQPDTDSVVPGDEAEPELKQSLDDMGHSETRQVDSDSNNSDEAEEITNDNENNVAHASDKESETSEASDVDEMEEQVKSTSEVAQAQGGDGESKSTVGNHTGGNDLACGSTLQELNAAHLLRKRVGQEADGKGGEADTLIDNAQSNGNPRILVERSVFHQKDLHDNFEPSTRPSPTIGEILQKKLHKCSCSGACVKKFFLSLFPFVAIMKAYNVRTDLLGDVVAGLTVGIMHIPQGMAYGMLTSLPPVYGLYMSFFPVLIYFFFGSSKHISIGTFAVACLMVGSSVSKGFAKVSDEMGFVRVTAGLYSNMSTESDFNVTTASSIDENGSTIVSMTTTLRSIGIKEDKDVMSAEELDIRLQFAMSVTFLVGILQLLMGVLRLGFITVYLSDSLISGFTTGAACHVFTSQIKHVFGIYTKRYSGPLKLIYTYRDFFSQIGDTNAITLVISIICMAILYSVSRFINQNPKLKPKMFMPVPTELIVVVLGTLISYLADFNTVNNVKIVDDIPTGLPIPSSSAAFSRLGDVFSDAIALAIVIFAISISMAKILAKKHDYEVDANQELVAFGIATIASSFFSSPAPSASLSRSLIQERGGGVTQVAGLVSSCLLLVVLLAIGPYFRTLPNCVMASTIIIALDNLFSQVFDLPKMWKNCKHDACVLASIIIIALRGMFLQVLDLRKLVKVSIIDTIIWLVAFFATIILDVDYGLAVAVICAILTIVGRTQRPYSCVLGRLPNTDIYKDTNIYKEAEEVEGIKIFRFEHSLIFVNSEHFRNNLYKLTVNPRVLHAKLKKRESKEKKLRDKQKKLISTGEGPDFALPRRLGDIELDVRTDDGRNDDKETVITMTVLDDEESEIEKPTPDDVDFHTIIMDCSPWSYVDSMGVKVLSSVIGEYKNVGVKIVLANCKSGIREMFDKTKFYDTLDHSRIFVSLHDAVLHLQHNETQNPAPIATLDLSMESTSTAYKDVNFADDDTSQRDNGTTSKRLTKRQ